MRVRCVLQAAILFLVASQLGVINAAATGRFLYGGVMLDDKIVFENGETYCEEVCFYIPDWGWICEEVCFQEGCAVDRGRIKNFLHLTNPNDSMVSFYVRVLYFNGTESNGNVFGFLTPRRKITIDMDPTFALDSKAYVIVSSSLPLEGIVETLYQEEPDPNADPEVTFDRGVDMPLVPFTSTRWRTSYVLYAVDEDEEMRSVLYVINPTEARAQGQIRSTSGGTKFGESNVDWLTCTTFDLPPRHAVAIDVNDLDFEMDESFFGFLEVDTGTALENQVQCAVADTLEGSVIAVVLTRAGDDLEMACGGEDFAEPAFGEIPYAQGLEFP